MDEVDSPQIINAFTDVLNRKWWINVTDHLNLLHHVKWVMPSSANGTAKTIIGRDGIINDLSKVKFGSAADATHRLSVVNASTTSGGVTTPKVRVYLGFVAGIKADAGMTDPSDSPAYTLTLTSAAATKYIICTVTVGYNSTTGIWSASACSIGSGSTVPAPTTSAPYIIYIPLAIVQVVAIATGFTVTTSAAGQIVSGDQWVARTGNATTYVDANGVI